MNIRTANVIVINKVNVADEQTMKKVIESCQRINKREKLFKIRSEISIDKPDLIQGKRVLVVEDGPSITHGEIK